MAPDRSAGPAGRAARVLIVSASHGLPPTRPRPERAEELGRALAGRGAACEHIVLLERPLRGEERGALARLALAGRRLDVVGDPGTTTVAGRALRALRRRAARRVTALAPAPGGGCPARLRRAVGARAAALSPDLVLVTGRRLRSLAAALPGDVPCVLDLGRFDPGLGRELRERGREDVLLEEAAELAVEDGIAALAGFDAVLVPSPADAAGLAPRLPGIPVHVVPPLAGAAGPGTEPPRPPRILFVGSETSPNLDALRWLRRRILPRVLRRAPSCRLRVVGECGRHLEPGADVERVGRVARIESEYALARVVALPLRLASGPRRRAVEALAAGRVLASTPRAVRGLDLRPGRDAVVATGEEELAQGIAEVLLDDTRRRRLEAAARGVASERFAPEGALAPLLGLLRPAVPAGEPEDEDGERCLREAIPPAAVPGG